jgi:hypothetical protein
MTPDQEKFYRRLCEHCDNFAARKSLSDQIEEEQHVFAQMATILTASQIQELSSRIFEQSFQPATAGEVTGRTASSL